MIIVGKLILDKINKALAIFLAVCFVMSVTAAAVSAAPVSGDMTKWNNQKNKWDNEKNKLDSEKSKWDGQKKVWDNKDKKGDDYKQWLKKYNDFTKN